VSVEETTPQTQLSKEPVKQSVKNQDSDGYYMLQVGSYSKQSIAEKMKENLAITGFEPAIQRVNIQGQGQLFRVQVGPFTAMGPLEKANRKLEQMGFKTLWLKVSKRP
jgi:cell division protein FtsN